MFVSKISTIQSDLQLGSDEFRLMSNEVWPSSWPGKREPRLKERGRPSVRPESAFVTLSTTARWDHQAHRARLVATANQGLKEALEKKVFPGSFHLFQLVQLQRDASSAHKDLLDLLETLGNKDHLDLRDNPHQGPAMEILVAKDLPDPLDHLVHAELPDSLEGLADLETLAMRVDKASLDQRDLLDQEDRKDKEDHPETVETLAHQELLDHKDHLGLPETRDNQGTTVDLGLLDNPERTRAIAHAQEGSRCCWRIFSVVEKLHTKDLLLFSFHYLLLQTN